MARNHSGTVRAAIGQARRAPTGSGIGQNRNLTGVGGLSGNRSVAPGRSAPAPAPSQAPAPAGAPSTQSTALPWDRVAELQSGEADKRYERTSADIAANRDFRERYWGIEAGFNDHKANPYSQAALLQHHHEVNQRGVTEGGQGNQLYSGATLNAGFAETRSNDIARNSLVESLHAEQAQWKREEREAKEQQERGHREAQEGAIQRANEKPLEPAPESGGGGGGGGDGGGGGGGGGNDPSKPGLGGDPAHPNAYRAGVGAGKPKPNAPPGYHAYKGPNNQWWFAPNR